MPRRRGPEQQQQQGDADEAASASADDAAPPLTREQRACEFLRRAMRSATHWRASMAMAKCLGVPQTKLLLSTDKNDATNLVWVTVLVLLFFTSQLPDLHELWYEMADAATAWLYEQPHFVDNRDDLVASACTLLGVRDVATALETVFPEPKDDETRALEQALGDWKLCYLDEPPYTAYYWNETTNMSTWRNPLETAQLEKERLEKKRQRDELLAKVLPMRMKINRDAFTPPAIPSCEECAHRMARKAKTSTPPASTPQLPATVRCDGCEGRYFCDECCDVVHATRDKLDHIEKSFRYVQCLGIKGFPTPQKNKITISPPRTPQTNQ